MFETILFPIDQSRQAIETACKALELARKDGSHLTILSVVEPDSAEVNTSESVSALLASVREKFEQGGVSCDAIERKGKPAFVICDVADELNVDLIIMGTRGINIEGKTESTASKVIQLAPCPVLVVP
ncbi:universal stress protein [Prochlorococcus sp. MIT 1300]|uniref:universal stress protein n=1 Tax=Prochlorococcus sp. MIT 1300 TaxID=3096218 RepID=UPI002A7508DB|nr:universal stress protein [Prochlorococcus sp. MIT 1300]